LSVLVVSTNLSVGERGRGFSEAVGFGECIFVVLWAFGDANAVVVVIEQTVLGTIVKDVVAKEQFGAGQWEQHEIWNVTRVSDRNKVIGRPWVDNVLVRVEPKAEQVDPVPLWEHNSVLVARHSIGWNGLVTRVEFLVWIVLDVVQLLQVDGRGIFEIPAEELEEVVMATKGARWVGGGLTGSERSVGTARGAVQLKFNTLDVKGKLHVVLQVDLLGSVLAGVDSNVDRLGVTVGGCKFNRRRIDSAG